MTNRLNLMGALQPQDRTRPIFGLQKAHKLVIKYSKSIKLLLGDLRDVYKRRASWKLEIDKTHDNTDQYYWWFNTDSLAYLSNGELPLIACVE